jgi:hypothetical protein
VLESLVRELDAARATARGLRARREPHSSTASATLDAEMLAAARNRCTPETLDELGGEAEAELAPLRDRMPPEAYERSRTACVDRERLRLPVLTFDQISRVHRAARFARVRAGHNSVTRQP